MASQSIGTNAQELQQGACCTCGHDHGQHRHEHEHEHNHQHGHAKINLTVAIIGGVLLLNSVLAQYVYPGESIRSTLCAVAAAILMAFPIIWAAIEDLWRRQVNMDVLVSLALLAAILMEYYREAGIIAFFMLIAITLEEKTAIGAKTSIEALVKLTPTVARLLNPQSGAEEEVSALGLHKGDKVRVRPGENFPADGRIVRGSTTVNQASITGESLPVDKDADAEVYAGTQNLTGLVDIEVTGVGHDTTLGKVRDLIEQAEKTRLPIHRLVDRYAIYYVPTVVMIAAVVWFLTEDLMRFVYVMVIACPCALVIATPSAVVAAIAAAARVGILIKNVGHIETAAKINAVVFDKTGTLTEGALEVARLTPAEGVALPDLLGTAVAAESHSNHPAAQAITALAREAAVTWQEPQTVSEIAGKGVLAEFADGPIRVGRGTWLRECGLDTAALDKTIRDSEDFAAMSIVYVSKGERVLGWIGLRDAVRPAAATAVSTLGELGVRICAMVTGDNETVARNVGRKIGIRQIRAECLPEQKVQYVEKLKAEGASVAVVGDGVNDAPALAAGDISIAMGAIGSDVAIHSASIALMNNDLRRVPFLIKLSRQTRTIIHINLIFGAFLIVGGMMCFIFGDNMLNSLAGVFSVNPTVFKAFLAASIHILGTMVIIFNSARLVRFGENLDHEPLLPPKEG